MARWAHHVWRWQSTSAAGWRASAQDRREQNEAGYAAIDALVALLLLTLGLMIGFSGLAQARSAADLGDESLRAQLLMTHLLQSAPRAFELQSGVSDGFDWRVETSPLGGERPIELCRRSVELSSATQRTFRAATVETCPERPE